MKCHLFSFSRVLMIIAILSSLTLGCAYADYTLTPKVNMQVEYNDNLFLTDENEVADFLTIISPGLSLDLKQKHLETELNYGLAFRKYMDETYLDRDRIEDIHRGDLNGVMLPNNSFSILYEGSIERISTDDRRSDVEENDIVNVATRYQGLLRPRYQYRLTPRVTGEVAYQYDTSRYDDDNNRDFLGNQGDDIVDQDIALLIEMKYSERLDLLVDTKYNWHDSDGFDDYEMFYGLAGFVWRPKEHLSLEAKAGGAITELDNSDDDLRDSLFRVLLTYSPPKKTGYFVSHIKDFTTSTDDGRYKWSETAGGVSYKGILSGDIRAFYRENTYQFIERKDEVYGGNLYLIYELSSKLSAGLGSGYEYRKYTPVKEKAHRYKFNCSLTYTMKMSELKLMYVANINDSDLSINDYKSNIVSLNFGIRF